MWPAGTHWSRAAPEEKNNAPTKELILLLHYGGIFYRTVLNYLMSRRKRLDNLFNAWMVQYWQISVFLLYSVCGSEITTLFLTSVFLKKGFPVLIYWFDWTRFRASQLLLSSQEKWKFLICCQTLKLASWLALLCLDSGISKLTCSGEIPHR